LGECRDARHAPCLVCNNPSRFALDRLRAERDAARAEVEQIRHVRDAAHMRFEDAVAKALGVGDRKTYSLESLLERIAALKGGEK